MLPQRQKMWVPPFYPWCCRSIFPKFLILFNFYPSSDFLPCQILPEETPMQEQESDNLLIENDPAAADIQTVDSPIQHITNGRKVRYSIYFSTIKHELKIFPDVCRCQCWEFRADSTRYYWCIIGSSSSSDRGHYREGTVVLFAIYSAMNWFKPPNQNFLIYRHLTL